jgi:hypothetical protein
MNLEHDLLQLARDAMRSLMNGRDFGTGQTGHYLNIISRIEDELNRPQPEQEPQFAPVGEIRSSVWAGHNWAHHFNAEAKLDFKTKLYIKLEHENE